MGSTHFTNDSGTSHDLLVLSCDSLTVSRYLLAVLYMRFIAGWLEG